MVAGEKTYKHTVNEMILANQHSANLLTERIYEFGMLLDGG
jgi:hypothetical protein